jgi:hypothetical protein
MHMTLGLKPFLTKVRGMLSIPLKKALDWMTDPGAKVYRDICESVWNSAVSCFSFLIHVAGFQIGLPSFSSLHVFLRIVPVRILFHALLYFRSECPQVQPSLITTEFYLNQFKEALIEAVDVKVGFIFVRRILWCV